MSCFDPATPYGRPSTRRRIFAADLRFARLALATRWFDHFLYQLFPDFFHLGVDFFDPVVVGLGFVEPACVPMAVAKREDDLALLGRHRFGAREPVHGVV